MTIVIMIVVAFTSLLCISTFTNPSNHFSIKVILSIIIGGIIGAMGTYEGCEDGWMSTNIGSQGACSHHGGVTTHINIYGISSLVICGIILFLFYLFTENKKSK